MCEEEYQLRISELGERLSVIKKRADYTLQNMYLVQEIDEINDIKTNPVYELVLNSSYVSNFVVPQTYPYYYMRFVMLKVKQCILNSDSIKECDDIVVKCCENSPTLENYYNMKFKRPIDFFDSEVFELVVTRAFWQSNRNRIILCIEDYKFGFEWYIAITA